jgi:hypothetical protein
LHDLLGLSQNSGALRHEVHPAEDDEAGLSVSRSLLGQAEGIAPVVPQGHDLLALVMMGEDEEFRPHVYLEGPNRFHQGHLCGTIQPRFPKTPGHQECLGNKISNYSLLIKYIALCYILNQ